MAVEAGIYTNGRRNGKSAAAFRTISEVADDLEVPPHVLRFWETKFTQVRPLKRGGGRRYYRPEDVSLLRRIRELLYADGYTIKGVQKLLRDGSVKPSLSDAGDAGEAETAEQAAASADENGVESAALSAQTRAELSELLNELVALRKKLADMRR
jgi:DNA-binding transcriptional MerR regulator